MAHLPLFIWNYLIVPNYKWKMGQIYVVFSEYLNLKYDSRIFFRIINKITIKTWFLWILIIFCGMDHQKSKFLLIPIWHPFWWRPSRPCEVKKVSNGGSGINFHYSGSQWASVIVRFVKLFGQARSLLYVNS